MVVMDDDDSLAKFLLLSFMGKRPKLAQALAKAQEADARKRRERELAAAEEERLKNKGKGKSKAKDSANNRPRPVVPFTEGERILLVGEGKVHTRRFNLVTSALKKKKNVLQQISALHCLSSKTTFRTPHH
jgi:hypothetical protein